MMQAMTAAIATGDLRLVDTDPDPDPLLRLIDPPADTEVAGTVIAATTNTAQINVTGEATTLKLAVMIEIEAAIVATTKTRKIHTPADTKTVTTEETVTVTARRAGTPALHVRRAIAKNDP
jgi:hypothetical protein